MSQSEPIFDQGLRYMSYKEAFKPHRYVFTTMACPHCKQTGEVEVPGTELFAYRQGNFIQDAMVSVSVGDRERLMTGICEPCFDKLFGGEGE